MAKMLLKKSIVQALVRDLTQYGLTPADLWAQARSKKLPRVLANSIPKAGTNLLTRSLYLIPGMRRKPARTYSNMHELDLRRTCRKLKSGQFLVAHMKFSDVLAATLKEQDVRNILIVRDPRAIAVSNYIYITKDATHRLHRYFNDHLRTDTQRLHASIRGIPGKDLPDSTPSLSLPEHIRQYAGWALDEDCLIVRFEELVGSDGGGSASAQRLTLERIYAHLGIELSSDVTDKIASNLYATSSRTFNTGQISSWKEIAAKPANRAVFRELDDAVQMLGY